ncbi:MAG: hypothetical protein MUO60_06245, partial [Clostridiaceae bacterium]|nr:hypothetical protein [Clostridiaceae bacterium]
MVLFQLNPVRFFTVYIGQGLLCFFFIFIAYKILQRDKGRLNLILSGFYIFIASALIINFIYAPIPDPEIQRILNTLTNYIIFFGLIFLPLFNLLLYKDDDIKNTYLIAIIGTYGIILFLIMFIDPNSVSIGPNTDWRPVWKPEFFYSLLV